MVTRLHCRRVQLRDAAGLRTRASSGLPDWTAGAENKRAPVDHIGTIVPRHRDTVPSWDVIDTPPAFGAAHAIDAGLLQQLTAIQEKL
jgi:hypothetical protein